MKRLLCAALCAAALLSPAPACTLFSASGSRVEGGGTLVAKNRDWSADSVDTLELVRPKRGYPYLALLADGGVRGGVNSRGFAAFSASASSLAKAERGGSSRSALARMLGGCASLADALARRQDLFGTRPAFYLIADASGSAWVEVAPGGAVAVRATGDGVLAHTNHYLDPGFTPYNRRIGASSAARAERIGALLASKPVLALDDFVAFGEYRSGDPDSSIWRDSKPPGRIRTLASIAVSLPLAGPPTVYAKLANAGEAPLSCRLELDGDFWRGGSAASLPFEGR